MLVASQAVTSIKAFKKEITFSYLEFDNVTKALVPATSHAFNVEIGVCAAVFILLSALMHGVVLLNWQKYIDDVNQGINKLRWYEYALSSSSKSCSFYVCAVHLRLSSSASSSSSSASSHFSLSLSLSFLSHDLLHCHSLWLLRFWFTSSHVLCKRRHESFWSSDGKDESTKS